MDRDIGLSLCEREAATSIPVRVAAIGDLHIREADDLLRFQAIERLRERADVLLIAGDLTDTGRLVEAEIAGELLAASGLPVVAVLGNHDLRSLRRAAFRRLLEQRGIEVLEGRSVHIRLHSGARIGIAGTTGCGGGFWPVEGPKAIQDRTMKRLALRTSREAAALDAALRSLEADVTVAVTHFAPTTSTLGQEPFAKYWMLGNCDLGVVLDVRRPDLVIHGHAHLGNRFGMTPGGLPVRNVALPVVGGVHLEALSIASASSETIADIAGLAS
jgi:Icc-related predicted phosphoesterase